MNHLPYRAPFAQIDFLAAPAATIPASLWWAFGASAGALLLLTILFFGFRVNDDFLVEGGGCGIALVSMISTLIFGIVIIVHLLK